MTPEILLSDQFAEFSGKVTALHERKKELLAEFKKIHEEFKGNIKAIDDEALDLENTFQQWAASHTKVPGPPNPPKGNKPTEVG